MQQDSKTIGGIQIAGELNSSVTSPEKLSAASKPSQLQVDDQAKPTNSAREIGGPAGPEPTRYGDWQVNGRCSDF
ncbi:MAG: DUF1674 domain-containing protein [Xanthomonadales bacterium]|nr:DUF1674 domain-containing protein [Xanthomonadales bacterium]